MTVKEILGAFGNGTYQISDNEIIDTAWDLSARYEYGRWNYYVIGVYNSGSDYAEINVDALKKLVNLTDMFSMFERKEE